MELPSLGTRKSQLDPQKPPQSNFPAQHNLSYRKAALEELSSGSLLRFTGEVLQVIEPDGLRVATRRGEFSGYTGDDVLLVFDAKPKILEGDIIDVMGRYDGTVRYETVMRTERVVPRIRVDYHIILKTKE
jgi:hypothetical protein